MAFLISTSIENHFVSALYSFEHNSFMVVGEDGYDWDFSGECSILEREEVIGTPIADEVFAVIDVIWLQDRAVRKFHRKWTR